MVARGDLHRRQGDLDAARTDYETVLALIEEQRLSLALRAHRESFLGRERQSVHTRLIMLLARQQAWLQAWQVCEQSRGRTFLDQLAQSHLPLPAGVAKDWWDRLQSTLDQIRILADGEYLGESQITVPDYQKQRLLAESQNRLEMILADAPKSADQWISLLKGNPIPYRDLQQYLSLS